MAEREQTRRAAEFQSRRARSAQRGKVPQGHVAMANANRETISLLES